METVVEKCVVLQIWHKNPDGSEGVSGYLGKFRDGRWPLVSTMEKADSYPDKVLAEGAANQYLGYLRIRHPERVPGTIIKYV